MQPHKAFPPPIPAPPEPVTADLPVTTTDTAPPATGIAGLFAALTTRRLATVVLFLGLFATAAGVLVDSDTFWHLRAGTWMLDHGRLLDFDAFSHTVLGRPWLNHSWLSEILMAGIYRTLGYGGLNLAAALVITLTLFVVHRSENSDSYLSAIVVALAAVTTAIYWTARPQLVSLLMAAVFNLVLTRHRVHGRNLLWLLPPLMVVWVNLHGGFAIGLMLIGATFLGELLAFAARRFRPLRLVAEPGNGAGVARPLWIGVAGLACVAAVAINPHGFAMLELPFKTVSIGVLQHYIQEWQSPDFHTRGAQFFVVLWLVAFGVIGASRRRLGATDFVLFALFSGMALLAARNIPVFAIVAAPILMRHADPFLSEWMHRAPASRRAPSPVMIAINWVLLAAVVLGVAAKTSLAMAPGTTEREVARTMPTGAVQYLRNQAPPGRLFNSYNFGGYLTWALGPDRPVFVDGRTDLYDDAFLREYIEAYMANPGWEHTLLRHDIRVVLVEPSAPLAHALLATPSWTLGYRDRNAVVIVKRGA